jgi:hypothetical protein
VALPLAHGVDSAARAVAERKSRAAGRKVGCYSPAKVSIAKRVEHAHRFLRAQAARLKHMQPTRETVAGSGTVVCANNQSYNRGWLYTENRTL